jgi:hypothetical protein
VAARDIVTLDKRWAAAACVGAELDEEVNVLLSCTSAHDHGQGVFARDRPCPAM